MFLCSLVERPAELSSTPSIGQGIDRLLWKHLAEWSSTNGVTWKEGTTSSNGAEFSDRKGRQILTFKNETYLIGGSGIDLWGNRTDNNDGWVSAVGKACWNTDKLVEGVFFFP